MVSQAKAPQTWFLNGLCVATDRADSSLAVLTGSIAEADLLSLLTQVELSVSDAVRTSEKTETQVPAELMGLPRQSGYLQQLPTYWDSILPVTYLHGACSVEAEETI